MAHSRSIATLILYTIVSTSAKNNARPVYEVINEQARMDDIKVSNSPGLLPYGNPLAGNSAQNARLHASNQQAMFNAEKIRQHKAQLQRLNQGPPIIDSYMKAYHESQESHQLALEQQQADIKETVLTTTEPTKKVLRNRNPVNRKRISNRDRNISGQRQGLKPTNLEAEVTRNSGRERSRNHRSYTSVEYQQYLQSKLPLAYLAAKEANQAVEINPNGNMGVAKEQDKEISDLHIAPSNSKYIPKNYLAATEIEALESILRKNPNEQLTEFKTLIDSDKTPEQGAYYPSNSDSSNVQDFYNDAVSQIPTYASAYAVTDYKPITEDFDDVENPYSSNFVFHLSTETPIQAVTNNYYKVEVASQTISSLKPSHINEELNISQHYSNSDESNASESYINYANGVQHLNEDGTGVSAYGDENVSTKTKLRYKRATLDTEPFLLPTNNETLPESSNNTDTPHAEALRHPFHKKRNDFNVFLTPTFQVGEAADYDYDDEPKPNFKSFYDDDDYYDDFASDYDDPVGLAVQPLQAPLNYPTLDSRGSFSHKYKRYGRPNPGLYGIPPSRPYGVPLYDAYAPQYLPQVNTLLPNVLEPVYMLTQSQLKHLLVQPNLNIEHLDVYQVPKPKKHYPRKYRKRYPHRHRNVRGKLHKLQKFNLG